MKSLPTIAAVLALGVITCQAEDPAKPAPPPGAPPHAEGDKKPGQPGGGHRGPDELFKKLDTDNSGDLSLAEFKAGKRWEKDPAKAEEAYKKLNTSNDGKLTADQFKAGFQKRGGGGDRKGQKPGGPKPDAPKAE